MRNISEVDMRHIFANGNENSRFPQNPKQIDGCVHTTSYTFPISECSVCSASAELRRRRRNCAAPRGPQRTPHRSAHRRTSPAHSYPLSYVCVKHRITYGCVSLIYGPTGDPNHFGTDYKPLNRSAISRRIMNHTHIQNRQTNVHNPTAEYIYAGGFVPMTD